MCFYAAKHRPHITGTGTHFQSVEVPSATVMNEDKSRFQLSSSISFSEDDASRPMGLPTAPWSLLRCPAGSQRVECHQAHSQARC